MHDVHPFYRAVAWIVLVCGIVFMVVGAGDDDDFVFVPWCLCISGALWVFSGTHILAMMYFADSEGRPRAIASWFVVVVGITVTALAFSTDYVPSVYGWFAVFWAVSLFITVIAADERLYNFWAFKVFVVAMLVSLGVACAAWELDVDVLLDKSEDAHSVVFFFLSSLLIFPALGVVFLVFSQIGMCVYFVFVGFYNLCRY